MPYIIETTFPDCGIGGCDKCARSTQTRVAVATVEQARDVAHNFVHAEYRAMYPIRADGQGGEHSDAQRSHRWRNVEITKLPESGGTIGPLPDGTVIEVREMSYEDIAGIPDGAELLADGDSGEIVAAFNAA